MDFTVALAGCNSQVMGNSFPGAAHRRGPENLPRIGPGSSPTPPSNTIGPAYGGLLCRRSLADSYPKTQGCFGELGKVSRTGQPGNMPTMPKTAVHSASIVAGGFELASYAPTVANNKPAGREGRLNPRARIRRTEHRGARGFHSDPWRRKKTPPRPLSSAAGFLPSSVRGG
jgi:hypothetical protein